MRLDYVKRTSKNNRQELLNKALEEELECLRKKCFPWKRTNFIWDDIDIRERDFDNEEGYKDTLGIYEYDEKELRHIIYITKTYIWGCQKLELDWMRSRYYKKLKEVIRHELIHAFVKERWEHKFKYFIAEKNRDASPLFLAILYWVGGYTSHKCFKGFTKTDLYKKLKGFKTYKELSGSLQDLLLEYMEAINEIKEFSNQTDFIKCNTDNYISIKNEFKFSPRKNGLTKYMECKWEDRYKKDGEYRYVKNTTRTWEVGCNVQPKDLIALYNRKQDCQAEYFDYKKQLIIIPKCAEVSVKDLKIITVKENKNF